MFKFIDQLMYLILKLSLMKKILLYIFLICLTQNYLLAQSHEFSKKDSLYTHKKISFSFANDCNIKFTFLSQIWARYTNTNTGTTVYGDPKSDIFDIGLRRTRIVLAGSLYPKINIFVQAGMNNFSSLSKREQGFFFHDVVADYHLIDEKMYIGGGLTSFGGFSRFSYPSVGTIMGIDAPLFAQATNGASDQFLRKLSIFTKGNINKFQYRVAISKPMAIQNSSQNKALSNQSTFSTKASKAQIHGYFEYSFFDQESHSNGYKKGTYLGQKKVFTIGAGFLHQQDAMQRINENNDTISSNLGIFAIDLFYDAPLKNDNVLSVYTGYFNYNFGKGYIRNIGAMNSANGNTDATVLNGAGSAFPMIGTGQIGYAQIGYSFHNKKGKQRIMPYTSIMIADYDKLNNNMIYTDTGMNLFIDNHYVKLTLAYQNRPIFMGDYNNGFDQKAYKGSFVTQFQIMF